MRFVRILIISIVILQCVVACSTTDVSIVYPTGEPTNALTPSSTVELIETKVPPTETTETSTPTFLPADTYVLNVSPWPEAGDLQNPINEGVIFETSPSQLTSGDYLISLDSNEHTVRYVNLTTEEEGVLLQLDEDLPLPTLLFSQNGQYILADNSNPRRFYDLSNQIGWEIGPLCDSVSNQVSVNGQWLHASCAELQRDDKGAEIHISEIISIDNGKGFRVAVPYSGSIYEIHFTSFDQDRLIVSKSRDDNMQANCAISLSDQLMYCPPIDKVSKNISYLVYNLEDYLAFTNIDAFPWEAILIPQTCFIPGEDCEPKIELGEVEGFLVPSPEITLIGWTTGIGLTGYTKFGYYDTATWESVEIVEIEGNYNIDAWCPDASCLVIFVDEFYSRYRLDLDGTLTPLPYEKVIGSFSIP